MTSQGVHISDMGGRVASVQTTETICCLALVPAFPLHSALDTSVTLAPSALSVAFDEKAQTLA